MSRIRSLLAAFGVAAALHGTGATAASLPTYGAAQVYSVPGWASTVLYDVDDSGRFVGWVSDGTRNVGLVVDANGPTLYDIGNSGTTSFTGFLGSTPIGSWRDADGRTWGVILGPNGPEFLSVPGAQSTTFRHGSRDGRFVTASWVDVNGDSATGVWQFSGGVLNVTDAAVVIGGVNSSGQFVGSSQASGGGSFLRTMPSGQQTASWTAIAEAGGAAPRLRDIADNGFMTGFTFASGGQSQVAIVGRGDLGWATIASPVAGRSILAEGLNESGVVVGFIDLGGIFSAGFVATPVPEPVVAWLLPVGLALVAARAKVVRRSEAGSARA